jgi:hypothetical protein
VCGGDVTPDLVKSVFEDLSKRTKADRPQWIGIQS